MVNKVNVQKAIDVMQRVVDQKRAFYMGEWREDDAGGDTERGLHRCGTAACFGGWLAVSPEWKADGGMVGYGGKPKIFNDMSLALNGNNAISQWLGISLELTEALTATSDDAYHLYNVYVVDDITAQQVLDKLIELRDNGCCEIVGLLR